MRSVLLDLVPVLERAINAVEVESLLAVLDALPRFASEQIDVFLKADGMKRRCQHEPALRVERQMVIGGAESLGKWPSGGRFWGRSAVRARTSLPPTRPTVETSKKRKLV